MFDGIYVVPLVVVSADGAVVVVGAVLVVVRAVGIVIMAMFVLLIIWIVILTFIVRVSDMLSLIDLKLLIVTADINVVDLIDLPRMDALLGKDPGFKVHGSLECLL